MATATKLHFKNRLLTGSKALGNSKRGLKEVCSDLINQAGTDAKTLQQISRGTFLSDTTLRRMASLTETEHGDPYRPQADTCERILRYFGAEILFDQVEIRRQFQNAPKTHDDDA